MDEISFPEMNINDAKLWLRDFPFGDFVINQLTVANEDQWVEAVNQLRQWTRRIPSIPRTGMSNFTHAISAASLNNLEKTK
jgi:hypothetical protein